MFLEIVSSRDSSTLDGIMLRNVLPGTTIWTDSWRGYGNLGNIGFIHSTVNHALNFVILYGVHTQSIESVWSHIKRAVKKKNGLSGKLWDKHFIEAVWKWQRAKESGSFCCGKRLPISIHEKLIAIVPFCCSLPSNEVISM
ncbi:hypothetical protein COOONC_14735 [Cooperia oncophora]